jgi:hypothetical protein
MDSFLKYESIYSELDIKFIHEVIKLKKNALHKKFLPIRILHCSMPLVLSHGMIGKPGTAQLEMIGSTYYTHVYDRIKGFDNISTI